MDEDDLLNKISKISQTPKSKLKIETVFSKLPGWDSFMWLELALELEEIGYETLANDIDEIESINDLLRKLQEHG